jgi:hypothetical protein
LSPVTVIGLALPVPVKPPGLEVTVYLVIGEPPLLIGFINFIVASVFPASASTPVGAPGTVSKIGFLQIVTSKLQDIRYRMSSFLLDMIISLKILNEENSSLIPEDKNKITSLVT